MLELLAVVSALAGAHEGMQAEPLGEDVGEGQGGPGLALEGAPGSKDITSHQLLDRRHVLCKEVRSVMILRWGRYCRFGVHLDEQRASDDQRRHSVSIIRASRLSLPACGSAVR